ncbi:elongation factor P isoform X3 [Eucalyptus grandis]|uniref:elongation factor P isoform X3 n=1 Tax=Eucalyptus grandis TaxID=71139 RepID=UPI00192E84FF|nr:elongation factor P isoform X3 [Eucalyptus grandis]
MASLNLSSSVASSSSPSPSSSAARSMLRAPALSLSSSKHSVFSPRSFPGFHRRASYPRIYALSSNDIKVGTSLVVDGAPWRVLEFLHVKPGKGAAFVRTKMRNYITGNSVEKTFRAGSSIFWRLLSKPRLSDIWITFQIDEADVFKETKQFTYKDGAQFVFMDLTTYEEIRLNESDVGDETKWLKEGLDCNLLFWNGKHCLCCRLLALKSQTQLS